jgi:hypothetical protein
MRFLVSGPVSSIVCRPTRPKRGSSVGSSSVVALGVAERLQELRDGRIAVLQTDRGGRDADLGQPGA